MLLIKDAVADVIETRPRHRLLRAQARGHLRRDPHAVLARRAHRRHRGHRRAHQDRRAAAGRRRRVPAHPHEPRARPRRTPATTPRSSPSGRCCAVWSRPAPASCRWATRARARSLDLVNNAQAEIYGVTGVGRDRGLRPAHRRGRPRRSTRSRRPSARDGQMTGVPTGFAELDELTNGFHPGPDDHRRRATRDRKVDARARLRAGGRRSSTTCRRSSSRSRWGAARSRCACCRPRHPCRCRTCARARVDSRDWTTIASTRGRINDAPLYIDD